MIAANDTDLTFLNHMAPDQLRRTAAQVAGLLAHETSPSAAAAVYSNISHALAVRSGLSSHTVAITPSVRDDALAVACEEYGVSAQDILGDSRRREVTHARQLAMWVLRQRQLPSGEPAHSYPEIARAVGRQDHTTALHACRKVEKRIAEAALYPAMFGDAA